MNKYFLPLVLFIFLAGTINAQPWMDKFSDPDNVDFKLKQKAFYEYWQKKDPSALGKFLESIRKKERTKDEDEKPGYKQFKRWEDFMSQRLPNGGFIPTDRATFDALNRDRTASRAGSGSNSVQSVATWEAIGPFGKPSGGGAGRVNVLVSDPSNASILYAGTPAGGLWKSTNGGTTWFSVNGLYSNMGVSAIAVDATNPNTIYIGTGDKDGDDTYSFGVLKTTDGGATWVLTSLNYTISQKRQINCLLVHPTKPNIVIASTSSGLMRSVDGGLNWFTEKTGAWNDLEFMPNNPDVIYVTNTGKVYKSVDAGDNWVLASTNLNTTGGNRLELAVTAANPNIIYAVASQSSDNGFLAFYKSSNGGATWKTAYNNTNKNLLGWDPDGGDSGGQGWYDLSIQAAPNDSNKVFVGGVNIWRTTNGGSTFTLNAHWYGGGGKPYVHADHHAMIAIPGTTTFLAGCDGGVFRTTNGGTAWSDVSNTMNIQQYYKLSTSVTDASRVTGGAQDNGTSMWNGSSWDYILGGDGMETLIDWSDADVIYGSQYNGSLNRSTDGGNSWDYITPNSSGAWVTPYIIHPTNPQILYGGYTGIWKTTNRGNSWTELTSAINIGQLDALEISRSNPNYIYGASSGTLYRTTDGGNNWTMLFSPSGSSSNITYIAISDTDPNKIWVTYSGYTNDEHVYKSLDAGDTWTNVSINLPNLPVNCVVYQSGSTNDAIYIGNDEGVYYINNDMSEWVSYNNGLPKVIVKELEIQYSSSKLRAATYGRGMFESDLYTTQSGTADAGISHILTPGGTSCVNTQVSPLVVIKNYGTQNLTYADINYSFNNTKYTFQWTGNLATGDTSAFYLPEIILANGNYTFTVSSDHPNSALDADGSNDTTITTFSTAQIAQAIPYSQDFESTFPPIGTTTKSYDVTVGWAKGVSANANSSGSAYMKNFTYTAKGQRDEFILPLLDFTPLQDPALFFDLAYTTANTLSSDTLLINVSTDCGATYTTVYKKWGADLTTIGAPQATEFTPDTTQWREEGINLEAFKGESEVLIKFININAKQNNLFVDNINIRSEFGVNTKNISTESIVLYPSAANDKIKVSGLNNQYNKASVIDVKGSCIKKLEFEAGNELELNISDLKDGMYFIKLGNGEKVLKFQKVD